MLKITKTRQVTAEFFVTEDKMDKLVKTTVINMLSGVLRPTTG